MYLAFLAKDLVTIERNLLKTNSNMQKINLSEYSATEKDSHDF